MGHSTVVFDAISFSYPASCSLVFDHLSVTVPRGWTGVVGGNGTGKTTLLKLAAGDLRPDSGRITAPEHAVYCRQDTDRMPDLLEEMLVSGDKAAGRLVSELEIGYDWPYRWESLSHGERKRAQVGTALWTQPCLLAVDEPTNHLDARARGLLFNALKAFQGIGLLVSHDRELLDALCNRCLFMDPPAVCLRPGSYSRGREQAELEEQSVEKERETAGRALRKLKQEAARRRDRASSSHARRSKRGVASKDHDAKAKIDLCRISGKDGADGRALKRLAGRIRQADETHRNIRVVKRYDTGIWLPENRSKRDLLFHVSKGTMDLAPGRDLSFPDLVMGPSSRVGITGNNGTGKSSLIRHILARTRIAEERVFFLPQETDPDEARELVHKVRSLPEEELGRIMTLVRRLGSSPARLMDTRQPSPGELRKLAIAVGIVKHPHLIVMDEPTNHLDLPSVTCLEEALATCSCGLLVVSHDNRFLARIARTRWHLAPVAGGNGHVVLEVSGFA
ncbi:ATP-binding cassette domain-containing protein [Desulfoluna butyratoxydans]|uniref:Abc transporter n=1 Tax=Desulfoluna butyratoxydans TaxID=231438 RepID=A0A4U8YIH8_9BACT|nr:ATP-binding cassette domain-containing protein [Desulfoluna butyratoxydans]VFQ43160.1 abc transporter [Desulfoluna butyratoxydans]